MTRDEIVAAISEITATLKGPRVPNVERLMLNEDRHDLRRKLAEMDAGVTEDTRDA